jgi:hypothetical protein
LKEIVEGKQDGERRENRREKVQLYDWEESQKDNRMKKSGSGPGMILLFLQIPITPYTTIKNLKVAFNCNTSSEFIKG